MSNFHAGKPEPELVYAYRGEIEALRAENEHLRALLTEAETVMMIVEPRSHKAEYLAALASIRAALNQQDTQEKP